MSFFRTDMCSLSTIGIGKTNKYTSSETLNIEKATKKALMLIQVPSDTPSYCIQKNCIG